MGREVKRVPAGFSHPLNTVWKGYVNPFYAAVSCTACDGDGMTPHARHVHNLWYGYVPFHPRDRGSEPFTAETPEVRAFAERNVRNSPDFYGSGEWTVIREARRLAQLFNEGMSHHLNDQDVAALVQEDRLRDFTHIRNNETGRYEKREPPVIPTARQVNLWSIGGLGHDSCNQWIVMKAECNRMGVPYSCEACSGEGSLWPSPEAQRVYEDWEREHPPEGSAYQIWETVSEGSPISPAFENPEELARWMTANPRGIYKDTSYETWLSFITGPGWAPSMVFSSKGFQSGVNAMVDL